MAELSSPEPLTQPPLLGDPNAEAAAAKAYAQAQRPWYLKRPLSALGA